MGLFGGLFGRKNEPDVVSRCMECGMAGGRHTDWCPEVPETQRPVDVPAGGGDGAPDETDGDAGRVAGPERGEG